MLCDRDSAFRVYVISVSTSSNDISVHVLSERNQESRDNKSLNIMSELFLHDQGLSGVEGGKCPRQ
jgi:hypothetical protein